MDLENPSLGRKGKEKIPDSWPQNPVTPVDIDKDISETFLKTEY